MEKVLVIMKPDGVERGLVGTVIARFEAAGLKLVALKMVKADKKTVERHYTNDEAWLLSVGKKAIEAAKAKGEKVTETEKEIGIRVRNALVRELTRVPVVPMIFEGNAACDVARKIGGSTEPRKADPGSIRGMYSNDSYSLADVKKRSVRNICHISENAEISAQEIKVWFTDSEIVSYKRSDEDVLYG